MSKTIDKRRVATGLAAIIVVASLMIGLFLLYPNLNSSLTLESVEVAQPTFESLALYWIAQDQGFFQQNGLNVTSHLYNTGAASLESVLKNEADIAVGPAEFPFVGRVLQNESIRAIGCLDKIDFIYVVGRRDRGIDSVSALAGKRVGTAVGTVAEFYIGRLLSIYGLKMDDIILVDVRTPNEWIDAVVNGTIDAVVTAQPYANLAREGLGNNAFLLPAQGGQPQYAMIISTNEWIRENPDLVVKFLSALSKAQDFAAKNPAQAKAIVKSQLNVTNEYIETVWTQNQFGLSIDQGLITAMEDESRWLMSNNLVQSRVMPDFVKWIYFDGLEEVKPESINIIR